MYLGAGLIFYANHTMGPRRFLALESPVQDNSKLER